jgi:hypothetical protein
MKQRFTTKATQNRMKGVLGISDLINIPVSTVIPQWRPNSFPIPHIHPHVEMVIEGET